MHRGCRYRIVLCVGAASQPADLLLALQPLLHFQTFAFRLPSHAADGSRAGPRSWRAT